MRLYRISFHAAFKQTWYNSALRPPLVLNPSLICDLLILNDSSNLVSSKSPYEPVPQTPFPSRGQSPKLVRTEDGGGRDGLSFGAL